MQINTHMRDLHVHMISIELQINWEFRLCIFGSKVPPGTRKLALEAWGWEEDRAAVVRSVGGDQRQF